MASRLSALEGKYEILGKLHEGGMGAVYKVRHRLLDQVRVVKVMRPDLEGDPSFRERFIREAQSAVRLRHPNIAHLYDFNVDQDGTGYIVMEFIAGRNLHELQETLGPLDVGVAAQLAGQSLAAIGRIHQQNLIHRDISPDNLVVSLDPDGEPQVKLIDFGIAKSLDPGESLTKTGVFIGKISYASPEHFGGLGGEATVEPRSDLYSLAVVLYELLTGFSPVAGTDARSILAGHLFYPPKPFAESDPEGRISDPVRKVVAKALEKQPDSRYPDAASFGRALQQAARDEIQACRIPGGPWVRLRAAVETVDLESEPAEPGSAQDRLDTVFPPSGEKAAEPTVQEPKPVDPQSAQLVAEARNLVRLGKPDQALEKVRQVLVHGSNRAEALKVKAEIEKAHNQLTQKLGALRLQTRVRARIRTLLAKGKVAEAEKMLASLRSKLAGTPAVLADLEQEIAKRKTIQDRKTAAEIARQAEKMLARQRPNEALDLLHSARDLDPRNQTVAELIARSEAELAARLDAEAREQAFRELLGQVDEALDEDSFEAAERLVPRLVADHGSDHQEVASRVRRFEELCERRQAEAKARDLAARLGKLVDEGRLQEAEQGLAKVISWTIETDAAPSSEWAIIEERIHRGREQMLAEAERLLQAGDLPAAEQAVARARQEGARPDQILRLERDIEIAARTPAIETPAVETPAVETPVAETLRLEEVQRQPAPAEKTRKRPLPRWLLAVATVALAAGIGFAAGFLRPADDPRPPTGEPSGPAVAADTGLLRLDALPWAELVAIVDAEGRQLPIPAERHTPMALPLSAGTYTLTLSHPSLPRPREVEVVLRPGETVPRTVEVAPYSAERYFEQSW